MDKEQRGAARVRLTARGKSVPILQPPAAQEWNKFREFEKNVQRSKQPQKEEDDEKK